MSQTIGRILAGFLIAALYVGTPGMAAAQDQDKPTPWPSADTTLTIPAGPAATAADTAQASAKSKEQPKAKKGKSVEKAMIVPETMPTKPAMAPAHIVVQHILIGFVGSVPGKPITRTKEQAKKLAYEILDKARRGADFDTLVSEYTDDRPPGIYKMSATGVSHAMGEYPRENMVPAFGDVGFAISPGNIDIADYDPVKSPYGWHIIKRLQ